MTQEELAFLLPLRGYQKYIPSETKLVTNIPDNCPKYLPILESLKDKRILSYYSNWDNNLVITFLQDVHFT